MDLDRFVITTEQPKDLLGANAAMAGIREVTQAVQPLYMVTGEKARPHLRLPNPHGSHLRVKNLYHDQGTRIAVADVVHKYPLPLHISPHIGRNFVFIGYFPDPLTYLNSCVRQKIMDVDWLQETKNLFLRFSALMFYRN